MKLRVIFFALVLIAIASGVWLLRHTEQTISPLSPTSLGIEKSGSTTESSIVVSSATNSERVENVASSIAEVTLSDSEYISTNTTSSNPSPRATVATNAVDPAIIKRVEEERIPIVDVRSASLVVAVEQYRQAFGVNPFGDNQAVSAALMGDNPNRTTFIEGHGWTNKHGELLDPWGSAYVFHFESNAVTVKSPGPNKMFGDTDDVVRVKGY